jgi:cytochrome c oxidase subunit 4
MAQTKNANHDDHGDHSGHHIVPLATYAKVLVALLFFTVLTVVVARPVSGFDAGILNAFIAFAIATVKAALVIAIFMGLKYDKKTNLAIFLTGIFLVIVMLSFSVMDIYTRIIYTSPL